MDTARWLHSSLEKAPTSKDKKSAWRSALNFYFSIHNPESKQGTIIKQVPKWQQALFHLALGSQLFPVSSAISQVQIYKSTR